MNYPYQINTFLEQEPTPGEPIYEGERGWFAHLNLKRRFGLVGVGESWLVEKLTEFSEGFGPFEIEIGEEAEPEFMPVKVLEIVHTPELMAFHLGVLKAFGRHIKSKFPEREEPYYPHVTLQNHADEQVVNQADFAGKRHLVNHFWLVKDPPGSENAQALVRFELSK